MAEKGTGYGQKIVPLRKWGALLTITKETGRGTLVQAHQTEVSDNPHRGTPRSTLNILCDLSLDL